jgi:hypothetical protein
MVSINLGTKKASRPNCGEAFFEAISVRYFAQICFMVHDQFSLRSIFLFSLR